jgi:hypothetical protein
VDVLEQLEEVLTLDQAQDFGGQAPCCTEELRSTQQMLDNLLGYFDDDNSPVVRGLSAEPYSGSDE